MIGNQIPSQDPADIGTLAGAIRTAHKKLMQSVDNMLPASLVAVTDDRNWAQVQPLISVLGTDGTLTQRAQIAKLPIFTIGGGGWVLSFPFSPGDLGWVHANDRDISLYLQNNAVAGPNTTRLHSFEDGVWIPDAARKWVLAGEDANRTVWQYKDGTIKIAQGPDETKLLHPTLIELNAPHVILPAGDLQAAKGVGAYGIVAPGAQPSVTGMLSAVTDGNAKAVLTSIIAIFTGNGDASDGTS